MEGGAFDYLVKPFDLDQARTVVERALEKSKSPGRNGPEAVSPPGSQSP